MADKDKTSPATTSMAYDIMAPRWAMMEALLGGTETMRAAGQLYLPKHEEETEEGYAERLAQAVLFNVTADTLGSLVGKPFREGMKAEDIPERLQATIWDDVDLQGNNAEVFCKSWFREGLAKCFAHVLVDMPRATPRADGQPRTLEDDRREKRRPYWVLVKPERLLFARASVVDGVEVLQQVRILEEVVEQDGFAEVTKVRIRVLTPGRVELWEPTKQKRAGKTVWARMDQWDTGLQVIPLVTFYTQRDGLMLGKPPLMDLAHLNVTHWQSDADQRHILKVARFPILACSGAEKENSDPVVVGPNKVLYNNDPQGKFYYVEHTGASIGAGRNDLQDLEERMATYGAEFLSRKPGDMTATEVAVDTAESTSLLSDFVGRFEDAVAQALSLTALWMGDANGEGGRVELEKDFGPEGVSATTLDALHKARERRDISRTAYINGLKDHHVLPEDFDMEADAELLADETTELLGGTMRDLNPGALPPKPPAGPTPAPGPTPKPIPAPPAARRGRKAAP